MDNGVAPDTVRLIRDLAVPNKYAAAVTRTQFFLAMRLLALQQRGGPAAVSVEAAAASDVPLVPSLVRLDPLEEALR